MVAWITAGLVAVYATLVTVGWWRARIRESEAWDTAAAMLDQYRLQEWERQLLRRAVFVAGPTDEEGAGELDLRS